MKPGNTILRNFSFLTVSALLIIFSLAAGKVNFKDKEPLGNKRTPPPHRTCATMVLHEKLVQTNPGYVRNQAELENFIREYAKDPANQTREVVTIPVVFHVVYKLPEENLPDAELLSQLEVLNEDFRKINADTGLVPAPYKPLAADIQIEFCMAKRDPNGNPTNGITRTQTAVPVFTPFDDNVKRNATGGKDPWNRDKYLNLWVCDLGPAILGYAQFPGGPAETDGVVIHYNYTGKINSTPPYNKGRTATHEVGHWINLRHIWGDAACGDDFVSDTPTQEEENYGCPVFPHNPNACGSNANGDMFMNYMDYVDDACMMMFSAGQSTRMRATIDGSRMSLKTSDGCIPPVPQSPVANFTVTKDTIITGGSTNYIDLTSGIPTTWSWTFPGGTPPTANVQNPGVLYSSVGSYSATLTSSNTLGSDILTKNNIVTVINAHSGNNSAAGNNLYYFANSTVYANAPSQPKMHWSDTAGSTNLIINSLPNPLATNTGGVDDGFFTVNTSTMLPGKVFKMFGTEYSGNIYIGTNGIISFDPTGLDGSAGYNPDAIPSAVAPNAALYPFWCDLDFDDPAYLQNRLSYKVTGDTLIITFDKPAIWGPRPLESDFVSFQAKLIYQNAGTSQNSAFMFVYDASKSGATFMDLYNSNGIQGVSGSGQLIGAENASGTQAVSYRLVNAGGSERVRGPMFMNSNSLSTAFGPDANALPVELTSFVHTVNERNVTLSWSTSEEINNSGFDIERKISGEENSWEKIAFVNGNGTTNEQKNYLFLDKNLHTGKYSYRLKQIDYNGNYEYHNLNSEVIIGIPIRYELSQNFPNPFNPVTKINLALPRDGNVKIVVYDISGREIKTLLNEYRTAGYYTVDLNASGFASGVYFYRMNSEKFNETKKMMLIK